MKKISIRAPAKGATSVRPQEPRFTIFQSALPRRERPMISRTDCTRLKFQSALPRRERPMPARKRIKGIRHFNPRSREGSDDVAKGIISIGVEISIRAPAKGATIKGRFLYKVGNISIRAPAKGAT